MNREIPEPFCFWRLRDIFYGFLLQVIIAAFLVIGIIIFVPSYVKNLSTLLGITFISGLGALYVLLRLRKLPLLSLGLVNPQNTALLSRDPVVTISLIFIFSYSYFLNAIPYLRDNVGTEKGEGVFALLYVIIFAPIVEELYFRGIVFSALYNFFKSPFVAIAVSATLFALAHTIQVKLPILTFVTIMPAGIILALSYLRARQIYTPILMHALANIVSLVAALIIST